MKILSAQQVREWDEYSIKNQSIRSIDLMERAALACVAWMEQNKLNEDHIKIFCGKGNNGGDGLAIARLLILRGLHPKIYILEFGKLGTADFQENLHQLHTLTSEIHFIQSAEFFPLIDRNDLVIDALFGSGLNRPLDALCALLVEHINQSGARVLSIDLPSGMSIDSSCKNKTVVRAKYTLGFQLMKRCFLMAENADNFGEIHLLDIGLDKNFTKSVETVFEFIQPGFIRSAILPRKNFSHKGSHGHALLLAGNKGKMGAAIIASKACLRSGVGMLTVNVPFNFSSLIHQSIPEAILTSREGNLSFLNIYKSIGIGPGLGIDSDAARIFSLLLDGYSSPMVIDADAITLLSQNKKWLSAIPAGSILSPHPKEFDRLFGSCSDDYERADKAIALSRQYPFIIILKGHYSLIAINGKGWYNCTGNAGLAKGGSGDVLTGILTALLAQQYPPAHAAMIGVYLHGLAADLALDQQSMESLLATDVIGKIGMAFTEARK